MSKNKRVIILVIILVVITLSIVGIFMFKNRENNNIVIGKENKTQLQENIMKSENTEIIKEKGQITNTHLEESSVKKEAENPMNNIEKSKNITSSQPNEKVNKSKIDKTKKEESKQKVNKIEKEELQKPSETNKANELEKSEPSKIIGNPKLANSFTFSYNKHKTQEAVEYIQNKMKEDKYFTEIGGSAIACTSKPCTNWFSYSSNSKLDGISGAGRIVKVYVEDIYMYDNRGIEKHLYDTRIYALQTH